MLLFAIQEHDEHKIRNNIFFCILFSNDNNIETIAQLAEALKHYVGVQTEYVRLDVAEKVVKLLTATALVVLLSVLVLSVLIYASFSLAHALGSIIGLGWGFLVVSAIYLLLLLFIVCFRKILIQRPLVHFLAELLLN